MKRKERKGMFRNTSNKTSRNKKIFSFSLVMIIFLASFATAIVLIPFDAKADEPAPPTIGAITYGGWDADGEHSDNNCYAQYRNYTITVVYTDPNGWSNLDYVQLKIGDFAILPGTPRITFHYDVGARTFSQIDVALEKWDFTSNYLGDVIEGFPHPTNDITITWKFKSQWDADEESDLDIRAVACDGLYPEVGRTEPNIFDVVTTLLTNGATGIECDDPNNPDRVDVGSTINMDFEIRYADDPDSSTPQSNIYPPGGHIGEFASVAIHNSLSGQMGDPNITITGGGGTIIFDAPGTVGNDTYHLFLEMSDIDYPAEKRELDNVVEEIITDRILVNWSSNQTTIDAGDPVTVTLADIIYDYNDVAVSGYQYDVTKTLWGESGTLLKDDYASNSFTFTPNLAGIYNFTISSINESTYGITANQTNQTIQLTVKQNISLVEDVNYVTWGANESVSASTLAADLGLEENDVIRKFNQSSTSDPWSDIVWQVPIGGPAGDFTIDRWDDLQIQVANSHSHSFTPDSAVDSSHTKTLNFTNSVLDGWTYVSWTNDFSTTPSNFASDLGISGENLELNVYVESTGQTLNYNAALPDWATLTVINPYDVICFRAPGHIDIEYDSDSVS